MTSLKDLVPHLSTQSEPNEPRRVALVQLATPEWLSERLSERYPGTVVTDVRLGDIVSGASTKGFFAIGYAPGGNPAGLPDDMILKGGFEPHSEFCAFTYLNEVNFYQDLSETAPLEVPKCFYAGTEPSRGLNVVLIENLNHRGAKFNTVFKPLTYLQVANGLQSLARYHARTWNSPELEPGGRLQWVPDTIKGEFGAIHDYFFQPDVWARFTRMPQFAAVSMIFHDADVVHAALSRLGEYQQSMGVQCVVHGDCHQGNTYLLPDDTVGFLDFQSKKTPWSQDASEFIVGTLDIVTRRLWEKDLLRVYLNALRREGVDAPDFDTAWDAHRRQLFYGLFKWLINEAHWQIEAINTFNTARYGIACLDHGTLDLLMA